MRPQQLKDQDLLTRTRQLAQTERETLTEILQHLKEIERRKLYSDLGYRSLFEYAVKELKYSEGQAGRRLQAMRLILDLPQVQEKLEKGELNLSHVCQAQSFFYQVKKSGSDKTLSQEEKLEVLKELEDKSARQAQVLLMERAEKSGAEVPLPKERERVLSADHSEIRLVISQELRDQLEEVRSLLGPKAIGMSLAQLIAEMAGLSVNALKDKKFGKKRKESGASSVAVVENSAPVSEEFTPTLKKCSVDSEGARSSSSSSSSSQSSVTSPSQLLTGGGDLPQSRKPKARSISKGKRYRIWERDGGCCVKCGAKRNVQIDHLIAVAKGGDCEEENLRLLCGSCNVRAGIKDFGLEKMRR